jgi:hypothetical protein
LSPRRVVPDIATDFILFFLRVPDGDLTFPGPCRSFLCACRSFLCVLMRLPIVLMRLPIGFMRLPIVPMRLPIVLMRLTQTVCITRFSHFVFAVWAALYFLVAETGPWPRDVIYFAQCMDHPSRKSTSSVVPLCPCMSGDLIMCRNIQQLGKWIHFYDDQAPDNASLDLFSVRSLHLHCTGSSHVCYLQIELANYHTTTIATRNPLPRPAVLKTNSLLRFW